MRILMISTLCFPRTIGGVENHILHLTRSLVKLGHHVEVIVPVIDESPAEATKAIISTQVEGITLHEIYIKGIPSYMKRLRARFAGQSRMGMLVAFLGKAGFLFAGRSIAKIAVGLMRQHQLQIVHQHDFSASIMTTKIISRLFPVVLTNHTGEFLHIKNHGLARPSLGVALSHYCRIIGPSPELAEVPYFKHKSVYIPNGVDLDFFSPLNGADRNEIRHRLGFSPEEFIILCPRRWAPTKGVIYLSKAIREVAKKVPNAKFLFAGSDYEGYPSYRKDILRELDGLQHDGLSNFKLLGDLDAKSLRALYQISDVVVIPSLMEATSLAALEAMASACPVLATNVGGMPDIISEGVNGFLVEPADPAALAHALQRFWSMGDKCRKSMGQAGLELVTQKYQWEKIALDTARIYEEALGNR